MEKVPEHGGAGGVVQRLFGTEASFFVSSV